MTPAQTASGSQTLIMTGILFREKVKALIFCCNQPVGFNLQGCFLISVKLVG